MNLKMRLKKKKNSFGLKEKLKGINKKKIIGSVFLSVLIIIFVIYFKDINSFLNFKKTFGSDADNVSGFARVLEDYDSESNWISFNCTNDSGLGGQNVFPFTFDLYFSFPPCSENDFGVDIGDDGYFTGYALSDKYGSIDFSPATSSPPFFDENTSLVSGYAKILSLGDDGWLNLAPTSDPVTYPPLEVDVNGDFNGYAYNDTLGWVCFNCEDESYCSTSQYNVHYYRPLTAVDLSAPNWSLANVCSSKIEKKAVLRWNTVGEPQTAYQIIIDDDSVRDDDTPLFDSGKITSTANQYTCPNGGDSCSLAGSSPDYGYGKSYYWWIKLWDTYDVETEWKQFNTSLGHIVTDNVDYNNAVSANPSLTFTTYKHGVPEPYFTWSPETIELGEAILFDSAGSGYYTDNTPNSSSPNPVSCDDTNCSYQWSTSEVANISNPTSATTTISFLSLSDTPTVTLTITDNDSYVCSTSTDSFSIDLDLPYWKEANPYED
ncbi:MAG: hypothetical protein EOL97_12415 [Spirochaetia bacterium]|nr:hypothetical protein [Spirochaetia bacterium]